TTAGDTSVAVLTGPASGRIPRPTSEADTRARRPVCLGVLTCDPGPTQLHRGRRTHTNPGTARPRQRPCFVRAVRPSGVPVAAAPGHRPQADDGVVIARGTIDNRPVVIASIEQGFQGGGTGEVSGAKINQALKLAAEASRAGSPTAAVLLLET